MGRLLSICCSWGKTQEAAALLQVAAAFPQSQLAELASTGAAAGGASSDSNSGSSSNSSSAGLQIEVVEVKNTCPFGHSRRGGRLRTNEFAVADRGPRTAVPPEWVPQLQLHMLCAGTRSGLLVSRSATKGMRVFRMQRDDELLRLMLLVISRLWQQHVLPGRPPPADVYASWHEHHDMMRRIREVANEAALVVATEDMRHMPGGDSRWFLD
ncbi:hypothetical protein CHLNCDRAFT_138438 [Chlorella variabilis]|uniref:Uncharacterized protein n=1 Tax=Chlorella variabilis TaxID=554065 RepID=E1ZN20_CHLVA|nr:hypothetical protein CHLNCDRAFT_138438 [Chlorella variabilis]EFN52793.1 hypothetical protein CHLNCDRAFT_138438 [Chlorella variabilis]|eukprot:XP_005844895.1 hypothetical protein CHLNCDRAFT_138438 [Chlorella variabilis]